MNIASNKTSAQCINKTILKPSSLLFGFSNLKTFTQSNTHPVIQRGAEGEVAESIIQQRTLALRINLFQLPISSASHSQTLGARWRLRTGLAKVRRTPPIAFAGDVSTYMRTLAPQVGSSFLNSVPAINFSISRNLRVIVFDFDGTLVDSNEIKTQDFL